MAKKLVWPVRVSEELGGRVDAAAALAGLPRSVWMVRALESALDDGPGRGAARSQSSSPASSRASGALESALSGSAPKGALGEDARVSPDRLKSDDSSSASNRAPAATTTGGFDPPVVTPGSRTGPIMSQRWAMDRQRKLNAGKEKAS